MLVITGQRKGKSEFDDTSQVFNQISTKYCTNLPKYPMKVRDATGGVLDGSPVICGANSGYHSKGQKNTSQIRASGEVRAE